MSGKQSNPLSSSVTTQGYAGICDNEGRDEDGGMGAR